MMVTKPRREREAIIVRHMIDIYCNAHHNVERGRKSRCESCSALIEYAGKRLQKCKFGDSKPVCKECPVHCYSLSMRENMKQVMRWSGPRMLYKKPLYAFIHMIDSQRAQKIHALSTE